MKAIFWKSRRFYLSVCVMILMVFFLATTVLNCPLPAVSGVQPSTTTLATTFEKAGQNLLESGGPLYPTIGKGYPNITYVSGSVPCIILKAVGYTETKWRQFDPQGLTVISFDCGYGIMQITSGMSGGAGFDPARVVREPAYNIGTGTKALIDKWNTTPSIGSNDPMVAENWYYAVWAYNGFGTMSNGYINNPNNPKYNVNRPPFNGTQPRANYPYQELVWGYAANSPGTDYWTSVPLTLPNRSLISNTPTHIDTPSPSHGTECVSNIPAPKAFFNNTSVTLPTTKIGSTSTSVPGSLQAYNIGGSTLYINSVQFLSGSTDFFYANPTVPIAIGANPKYVNLYFSFKPSSKGNKTCTFRIFTSDPTLPSKDITLYGFGSN